MSRRTWIVAVAVLALFAVAGFWLTRSARAPGDVEGGSTPSAAGPAATIDPTAATPPAGTMPSAVAPLSGTAGITPTTGIASTTAAQPESAVREIALDGPLAVREAEVSGMAWFSDTLVFLPQYPGRFGYDGTVVTKTNTGDGTLFGVRRADVEAALTRQAPSVTPFAIPVAGAGFGDGEPRAIDGFEGFEAIAFHGRTAYVSIEVQNGDDMAAFVVRGTVDVDADGMPIGITIDAGDPAGVPLPVEIDNMSIESLVADAEGVTAIFEANGSAINPSPSGYRLTPDLQPAGDFAFPTIEYRVTDASEAAPDGSFWMTNYMFPGDAAVLKPSTDGIAQRWGEGATHASFEHVERIIRIERLPDSAGFGSGYKLADEPPVQLALLDAETARNWEGLVTLGDMGFLVVTDKFPSTIFAFVPVPDKATAP